jgi:MEDS: MEthanogen/methylotroph, DcmR Sensory domain
MLGLRVGMKQERSIPHRHVHAVRFYKDSDSLCQIVAGFLAEGLTIGEPALVVATEPHRRRITQNLTAISLNVRGLERAHQLLFLDAGEVLSRFMVDSKPHSGRFTYCMAEAFRRLTRRSDCAVRCYGEMVDILWQGGRTEAAIRLEILWNHLANTHAFSLWCGYSMSNFYKDNAISDILRHHTHPVSETGYTAAVPVDDRLSA